MIITYHKNYGESTKGIDWVMHSDVKPKDTKIIHHLYEFVKKHKETKFNDLPDKMREEYKDARKNQGIQSFCDIYSDEREIEVTNRGIMPRFYILPKNEKI